ncbi:MAG: beta-galactosidase trimerization domain-containing protein [Gaiellales bacterium]
MWTSYDPDVVRDELRTLAEHGLNVTRSFCYWPDFVPEPERLDDDVLARFADFLEAHRELGLTTIPTFVVGHMSGENWDPAWRQGRDLYRDVWLVAQQAWLAEALARRFASHPAISGWLVSNEMPLYGGPASSDEITAWARLVVQALRAGGATQPISLGDGAWGIETTGHDNGYSIRALEPLIDFIGPHVYPMQDDQVRQLLRAAYVCELCDTFGLPVVLEEFGVSSDFASDENASHYYRQVLHTSLLAGAKGWLAWNNCDYDDLRLQPPYSHHLFELHFGLTDAAGRPKPQLAELARFSRLLDGLGEGWQPVRGGAAIVVPEHFETAFPFTTEEYRRDIDRALFQSYVAAREADLPVGFVRERDGLGTSAPLLVCPSAKLLTAAGIDRLRELVSAGATLYLSVFNGSTDNQRGPWLGGLRDLFGVRQLLRYGLVDPIEDDVVSFELVRRFGDLEPGEQLHFRVAGNANVRSYLPVEPEGAEVVAIDSHGRPAILVNDVGDGKVVLCTYPLELLAAQVPAVNPEDTARLYGALAIEAGLSRPVRVDDARVLIGRVRSEDRRQTVLFVNTSPETVDLEPLTEAGVELVGPRVTELGPFEVAVVALGQGSGAAGEPVAGATGEGRDAPTP